MPIKIDVCQNGITTIVDTTEVDKYMICMCMTLIYVNIRNLRNFRKIMSKLKGILLYNMDNLHVTKNKTTFNLSFYSSLRKSLSSYFHLDLVRRSPLSNCDNDCLLD